MGQALLLIAWWQAVEAPNHASLLGTRVLDLLVIGGTALVAWRRGVAPIDSALWCLLSRRLHLDTAAQLEAYDWAIPGIWAGWLTAWAVAATDRDRYLRLWFHAGLLFAPAVARTADVGMPVGWESQALDLLLLTAALHALVARDRHPGRPSTTAAPPCTDPMPDGPQRESPPGPAPFISDDLLLVAVLLVLACAHAVPASTWLSSPVLASVATGLLFWSVCLPGGWREFGSDRILLWGGVPLALAAIGIAAADGPTLAIGLRRRWSVGGVHPNLLAFWGLLAVSLLPGCRPRDGLAEGGFRLIHAAGLLVAAMTVIGSGSRMGVLLLGLALLWKARDWWGRIGWPWRLLTGGGVAAAIAGSWVRSSSVLEWVGNERWAIWAAAFRAAAESPWSGHGILPFRWLAQPIDPGTAVWVYDWNYPHSHQAALELALWGGMPLLAVAILLTWRWWGIQAAQSDPDAGRIRLAAVVALLVGLVDFPWFNPALVAVLLPFWRSRPGHESAGRRRRRSLATALAVVLGVTAGVGIIGTTLPFVSYQEALARLRAGRSDWPVALDRAVTLAPHRSDLRLQHLLWHWHTGRAPDARDEANLRAMAVRWPRYYLIPWLQGRIELLAGNPVAAGAQIVRSLALEPRDTTGIRWATLATARRAAGSPDWVDAAWEAVVRGSWGQSMVLDHPDWGVEATRLLAARCSTATPTDAIAALPVLIAAKALQERGVSVGPPAFAGTLRAPVPDWVAGEVERWQLAFEHEKRRTGAGGPPSGDREADPTGSGIDGAPLSERSLASLLFLGAVADRAGDLDTVATIATLVEARWTYHRKNDEELWTPFWLSRRQMARGEFDAAAATVFRLTVTDPHNPWLLERLGEIEAAAGRTAAARAWYEGARRLIPSTRREPTFDGGPRWRLSPAGDQWTMLCERALRRFDPVAGRFHERRWAEFVDRLGARIASLPPVAPGSGSEGSEPSR